MINLHDPCSTRISELIAPAFLGLHREILAAEQGRGCSEFWLKGGRGSAKSSFISLEIVMGLLRNPSTNAIIYRRVAATLRESVYEQMLWALERMGVRGLFDCRVSPMELRYLPTGQRVLFRGADDPAKSKSLKLSRGYFGYLWFEELAEFTGMDAVRTIRASVLRGAHNPITFCSYNPPRSAQSWVNSEALIPKPGRRVHSSSYLDVPPGWLGEDFIAEAGALRSSDERAYRHMYLGEVTGTGGAVFENLDLRHVTGGEIDGYGQFFNGLDFGFAMDPDAFVRWAYDAGRQRLLAVDEFYGARNPTERLAAEVARRAGGGVVRCDSADPRMIAELKHRGISAVGVKKGPRSVEYGMRWLQDLNSIIIDPVRTPNIAREFSRYEYGQDRDGNFLAEYPDRQNHAIDATRYAMEPAIGQRRLKTMNRDRLGL